MSYVSIHNHDMYSTLDGFSTPKEMLDKAQEIGLKGYCITNHGNAFSLPYYEKIKDNYPDLKVIYGVELYECLDKNIKDNDNRYFHLIALARNENGRIAINKLITKSNFEGFYYKPRIEINDIKEYASDLIISSACLASKLSREQNYDKCIEYVKEYKSIFQYFYLEIQSHNDPDQHDYNTKIINLAKDTDTKFVITTDSHFANKDDLQYQQQFVSIAKDSETMMEGYAGCYIQTEEEIHEILDNKIGKENVDLGLKNTLDILDLVEDVKIPFQEPKLPHFEVPSDFRDTKEYVLYLAEEGWKRKINLNKCDEKTYRERFNYEISVIFQMGFEGYFLILWDILKWARDNNIAVGAGRGSAAGSLVSYLLDITDLDPIKYKLIFERFLNPERISMPDIDVDVSDRQSVLNYLEIKYGVDKVCQVANFSTITPKVAISDAARIINSREKINKIPTSIIQNFANIFSGAEEFDDVIENNKLDIDNYCKLDSRFTEVIEIAKKFSGKVRQLSIHACAVGIVDGEIVDYMPMHNGGKGEKVIQADKRIVEDIGIVKFDLLGISTLDVLQKTLNYLEKDFSYISPNNDVMLEDKEIYKIITNGNTEAIFQLESYGMKDVCKKLKPENIEDISAILALYRPDTMQLMEDYIERKHGRQEITYIHPDMQPILKDTFGAMIYQEQLLDIVRKFGGRTYGGADKFRKGIGKKDTALVKKEAVQLYDEIVATGYSKELAKIISDDMSTKGGYSFNKSHSMSYAMLTIQTAYLKTHHSTEYFTALLNININDYNKLNKYITNARENKVEVLSPDIKNISREFIPNGNSIIMGIQMIKGLGEKAVEDIFEEIKLNGNFKDFDDFINRTYSYSTINKTAIIALIKAGAFGANREYYLKKYCDNLFEKKDYQEVKSLPSIKVLKEQWGIESDDKEERLKLYNEKKKNKYDQEQIEKLKAHRKEYFDKYMQRKMFWEFDSLSVFLTYNPYEKIYGNVIPTYDEIENGQDATIVGIIVKIDKKMNKQNKKQYAFIEFNIGDRNIELILWTEQYGQYAKHLEKGLSFAVFGIKKDDKFTGKKLKPFAIWKKEKCLKEV